MLRRGELKTVNEILLSTPTLHRAGKQPEARRTTAILACPPCGVFTESGETAVALIDVIHRLGNQLELERVNQFATLFGAACGGMSQKQG